MFLPDREDFDCNFVAFQTPGRVVKLRFNFIINVDVIVVATTQLDEETNSDLVGVNSQLFLFNSFDRVALEAVIILCCLTEPTRCTSSGEGTASRAYDTF